MEPQTITGLENVSPNLHGCVLTIGNFDGVHRGHQAILARAGALAERSETDGNRSRAVVAMTFEPPPDLVLRPDDPPQRLTLPPWRETLLLRCGADVVVTVQATPELLGMAPGKFVREIIQASFAPSAMVEGPNFFYGRRREGTTATLQQAGRELGFEVEVVEPCVVALDGRGVRVSSTVVRGLLGEGQVAPAGKLLGRPFAIVGPIVHGEHLGRTLDYPTANLDPTEHVVPADGVYAGLAEVAGWTGPAAISIGCKPTFRGQRRFVEAYLLGARGDFYGQRMILHFLDRLRDQEAYDSAGTLIRQIRLDVDRTRQIASQFQESKGDWLHD
jgi:riboflavin kinase / FMN adenylyltransferase